MSTRRRFENLKTLLDALDNAMEYGVEFPPSVLHAAQNVAEEFKDELSGDAISVSWHIDDIHSRNDENDDCDGYKKLTDADARDILTEIERKHDASIGINWDVIDVYLNDKG